MTNDRKRLSKEKHEISYVRKLARNWLQNFKDYPVMNVSQTNGYESLERICKAVLKFARYKKK